MELQKTTKLNIIKTTGLPISSLLDKKPVADARLKKLQRQPACHNVDVLVRGNPQLTVGQVTPTETVYAYFENKRKAGGGDGCRE